MLKYIKNRIELEVHYIIEDNLTIREIANILKLSKSTVHKDLTDRLKQIDQEDYKEVKKILQQHNEIKHIKGGNSTKLKYKK